MREHRESDSLHLIANMNRHGPLVVDPKLFLSESALEKNQFYVGRPSKSFYLILLIQIQEICFNFKFFRA